MIIVVADTSGLLAALDEQHPDGAGARRVLADAGAIVISPVLLGELDHMACRLLGRPAAHSAIGDVVRWARAGRALLPQIDDKILATAQRVREGYRDLRLDLANAVNVALAAEFATIAILTLDQRDFRAVRPLTGHAAFRILPQDLSPGSA